MPNDERILETMPDGALGLIPTRQIRKLRDQKKASIPVIVMTANAFEEDRNEAFAAGMDEHVAKSVEIINLPKP